MHTRWGIYDISESHQTIHILSDLFVLRGRSAGLQRIYFFYFWLLGIGGGGSWVWSHFELWRTRERVVRTLSAQHLHTCNTCHTCYIFYIFAHLLVASCYSSHSIKCATLATVKPQLPHLTIRLKLLLTVGTKKTPLFSKKILICIVCLNTFHLGVSNAK